MYDIGDKVRIFVNGKVRIPDGLTPETLNEVKNVAYQSFGSQLVDFASYAQNAGLGFDL